MMEHKTFQINSFFSYRN